MIQRLVRVRVHAIACRLLRRHGSMRRGVVQPRAGGIAVAPLGVGPRRMRDVPVCEAGAGGGGGAVDLHPPLGVDLYVGREAATSLGPLLRAVAGTDTHRVTGRKRLLVLLIHDASITARRPSTGPAPTPNRQPARDEHLVPLFGGPLGENLEVGVPRHHGVVTLGAEDPGVAAV